MRQPDYSSGLFVVSDVQVDSPQRLAEDSPTFWEDAFRAENFCEELHGFMFADTTAGL
jgi:hypothetical protein